MSELIRLPELWILYRLEVFRVPALCNVKSIGFATLTGSGSHLSDMLLIPVLAGSRYVHIVIDKKQYLAAQVYDHCQHQWC